MDSLEMNRNLITKTDRATLQRLAIGAISGMLLFYSICGWIFFIANFGSLLDPKYDTAAYLMEFPLITFRFIVYAAPVWLLLPFCLALTVGIAIYIDHCDRRRKQQFASNSLKSKTNF